MEHTQNTQITDLLEFDNSISLWQMIPSGKGKALALLRTIVDSIHNSTNGKTPSILVVGEEGKKTHARAFVRALGIESITEVEAALLQPINGLIQFFSSVSEAAYLITNAKWLVPQAKLAVAQIFNEKHFSLYNYVLKAEDEYQVPGIVILTATDASKVPEPIISAVDYVVHIEPYTGEQLLQIIRQRLKYCGLRCRSESVLIEILKQGNGQLKHIMRILRICIAVVLADGRDELLMEDLGNAMKLR